MAEQLRKKPEQLVIPPRNEIIEVGRPVMLSPAYMQEAREYLTSYGWKEIGVNDGGMVIWEDPKAHEVATTNIIRLPNKEYGYDQVKQLCLPPLVWQVTTDVAMQRQRERNQAGETLDQTIERKEAELEALYANQKKQQDLIKKTVEASAKQAVA